MEMLFSSKGVQNQLPYYFNCTTFTSWHVRLTELQFEKFSSRHENEPVSHSCNVSHPNVFI